METEHVEEVELEGSTEPQREPLHFRYDSSKVSPEMGEVMESIKWLAESLLFHWKTFPIVLPQSSADVRAADGDGSNEESKLGLKDLFIAPSFDELEEVAKNKAGNLKKLNDKQLASIWNKGEFEVDSIHFPGQVHKWRLSQLLQKGTVRSHDTLLKDAALALRLLIITARNRFSSQFFSLTQSVHAWGKGLWKLLDVFVGMPSTTPGDLCTKVKEEHMCYLVAELNIKPSSKKELYDFCEYIKEQSRLLKMEKQKPFDLRPPPITYRFLTPKGQEIDLRLFNQDLINNCLPILSNILDREAKGWTVAFRHRLVKEYRGKNLSDEKISELVNEAVMEEYLQRVFTSINSNAELNSLQQGLGELLVSQAKSVIAMQKAVQNLQEKMQKFKEQLVNHLKKEYPVKSRIRAWMNEQQEAFKHDFITQNLWSAHEEAISICEDQGLQQAIYFLRRDLNFIKERDAVLHQELSKVKKPTRTFSFSTRIWLPRNWIIRRQSYGDVEVIVTVIRDGDSPLDGGIRNITYSVSKYTERKTTTRHPFWRWWNYFHRSWAWTWNSMFLFGVIIPWCSSFSLRSLFFVRPFMPDLKLSQVDGALYPKESSLTHTLVSRFEALWKNVRHSRKQFEEAPDTGFLGKSLTRHLNRFWNYVLKGAAGSLLLVLVFPLLCLSVSSVSLVLSITSPVWVPTLTLLAHVSFFIVYDIDCPDENSNKISILLEALIWRILIQGCFQPVAAFLFGAVCCPLSSLFIIVFGVLRRGGRGLWDSFMFHAIIKSRGRIPASDGFVARRIAGPGLASNYFYQIRPEQTLAALEASIELDELEAWKHSVLKVIDQPKEAYRKFIEQCFKPFSADIVEDGVYRRLVIETALYRTDLVTKATERERHLYTGLYLDLQRKIRLSERDLKLCILLTSKLLEKFYPEHVLSRLDEDSEEEFWEKNQLEYRDWKGFACKKLADIFSKGFLTPLEETDVSFELKVQHLNLSRYVGMLASAEFHDDLDLVTEIHTPTSEITVKSPSLDPGYFNPNQKLVHSTHLGTPREKLCPWKTFYEHKVFDKLEIPLPIPHPTNIAVSIYNRENDQDPINLDDVFCQRIIRAAKEVKLLKT
ncbi:uncharacterized protein LOC121378908 [Gigantopelta aegis]|uniref:uncharacterized protein LOC121378908 n=1 Tax=Gigantopelta aegis TaxID=1735272 RepID=UPI001B88B3BA|nr:uncharacterized protein LOC121378908 [Gigantopelta aegis]